MKLKELKSRLTYIQDFLNPNITLEQYITPSDIAALFIYTAHHTFNDIENKKIVDLCAGTGMLSIAASFYSPRLITCVEIDKDVVEICKENFKMFEIVDVIILNNDINDVNIKCDTVFMNPPFGTRNSGADIRALEVALGMGSVVYSMHKRSTRSYILKKFVGAKVIAEVAYEIGKPYSFHKKKQKVIEVDIYRIDNGKK